MSILTPGACEVRHEIGIPGTGGPAFVVYGVNEQGGFPDAEDLAEFLHLTFQNLTGEMDSSCALRTTRVSVGQDGGPPAVGEFTQVVSGGIGGDGSPPQVAFLLKKSTGFAGRRNRGRMYLPGVPENSVDDGGVLSGAKLSTLTLACQAFFDALSSNNLPLVLLHSTAPADPTLVTQFAPDNVVATQRRRLR